MDETTLRLFTWISDSIRPGQRAFQVILDQPYFSKRTPTNWEDYSEKDIREMFMGINSSEDFDKVWLENDRKRG